MARKTTEELRIEVTDRIIVAEMCSCIVSEHISVPTEQQKTEQSAAYIKSWLKAMKNDNKFIFTASKWAQAAADGILKIEREEIKQAA